MQLVLNEEQELIAKTAADFMLDKSPVSRFRALRDGADAMGYSRSLWKEMAELGWLGIPFSERVGGVGMGMAELSLVLEQAGRMLAPEPFHGCIALAGQALACAGSESQQKTWLEPIISGDKILALAYQEPSGRYDLRSVQTCAERAGEGWRLSGNKVQVLDGHGADALIVSARTSESVGDADGISLFLLPADTPGLEVLRQTRLDNRNAALVNLNHVELPADALLGELDRGGALLEQVVDSATVALCAEMLGGMSQAFDLTLEYLKQRKQFDVPIGSFQALKHRMAKLFMEIELSRSSVMAAARALDENSAQASRLVSLAKARCSDSYILATNEAVQIYGGVGMTDEYDVGFYMKRARAAEMTFGDAAFHRERWARLEQF